MTDGKDPVVVKAEPAVIAARVSKSGDGSPASYTLNIHDWPRGLFAGECQGSKWSMSSVPDVETIEKAHANYVAKLTSPESSEPDVEEDNG